MGRTRTRGVVVVDDVGADVGASAPLLPEIQLTRPGGLEAPAGGGLGAGAAIRAARLREARAAAERGDVRAAVLRLIEAAEG